MVMRESVKEAAVERVGAILKSCHELVSVHQLKQVEQRNHSVQTEIQHSTPLLHIHHHNSLHPPPPTPQSRTPLQPQPTCRMLRARASLLFATPPLPPPPSPLLGGATSNATGMEGSSRPTQSLAGRDLVGGWVGGWVGGRVSGGGMTPTARNIVTSCRG